MNFSPHSHHLFDNSLLHRFMRPPRDTREGWPLLTDETEKNADSKSTNERGPSLVGLLGLSCQYKRFWFCLGCSSWPSIKYLFPPRTLFQFLCIRRPASWAGSRAGSPVSWYVSLQPPLETLRRSSRPHRPFLSFFSSWIFLNSIKL